MSKGLISPWLAVQICPSLLTGNRSCIRLLKFYRGVRSGWPPGASPITCNLIRGSS